MMHTNRWYVSNARNQPSAVDADQCRSLYLPPVPVLYMLREVFADCIAKETGCY